MMINNFNRMILNLILLLMLLYFSVFAAWYAAYSNYFFFPVVYKMENISAHVDKYAPQNRRGKSDFRHTVPAEHLIIFNQMLRAVNDGGKGLQDIKYHVGGAERRFLTRDEFIHLMDVSKLISMLKSFASFFIVLLVSVMLVMIFSGVRPYSLWSMVKLLAGTIIAGGVVIAVFGFEKLFNGLHELVFPPGHKWFFYYQDSLMSTMLKAPDSFAVFGIILGIFAVAALIIFYLLVSKFIKDIIKKREQRVFIP